MLSEHAVEGWHVHVDLLLTTSLGIVGSIVGGLIARLFSKPRDGDLFHPAGLILCPTIIGINSCTKLQTPKNVVALASHR
jgi:uncharacterized membrane protein YeaQ/YmgE (transglycosylase-associated protein family)